MAATDYDWQGFRALSARLHAIVSGETDEETLAEDARKILAYLYTAGVSMPSAGDVYEDAGGDGFWERTLGASSGEVDPAVAEARIEAFAQRLQVNIEAIQDIAEVGEDYDDLLIAAAQNLSDVDFALAEGAAHFDAKRLNEAAWEWSFGFDEWGAHALAALNALHELVWGAL